MTPTVVLADGNPVPITDEIREEAALICAISASTPDLAENYCEVALYLGITGGTPGFMLALDAWQHVVDEIFAHRAVAVLKGTVDAEAEALLRSGWSPS